MRGIKYRSDGHPAQRSNDRIYLLAAVDHEGDAGTFTVKFRPLTGFGDNFRMSAGEQGAGRARGYTGLLQALF